MTWAKECPVIENTAYTTRVVVVGWPVRVRTCYVSVCRTLIDLVVGLSGVLLGQGIWLVWVASGWPR